MSGRAQVYSPAVIDAVGECLRTFYWYKNDLQSFLKRAGIPPNLVAQLPWATEVKRECVRILLDGLSREASRKVYIDKLIDSLVEQNERFPHLAKEDDGERMVKDAREASSNLKSLLGKHSVVDRAERARQENRTEAARSAQVLQSRQAALDGLNRRFKALCASTDVYRRGYDFQVLLRDLFALYDLEPTGSFALAGEQTDGALKLDGTVILIEARWKKDPTPPSEIVEFRGKVHDKLDGTLGLFVSMSGYGEEAVKRAASGGSRMVVILADGADLAPIFAGNVDLVDVLRRKLRHAAERGIALYRVGIG